MRIIGKFISMQIVAILAVLLAGSAIFIGISRENHLTDLQNSLARTVGRLSLALTEPMWNFDQSLTKRLLELEMGEGDLIAAILKEKGSTSGFIRRPVTGITEYGSAEGESALLEKAVFTQKADILRDGTALGTVEVYVSDRSIRRQMAIDSFFMAILVASLVVILSVISTVGIRAIVVRPIAAVTAKILEIAAGGGDLSKTITHPGRDEIGSLVSSFNEFLGRLRGIVSGVKASGGSVQDVQQSLAASTTETSSALVEITSNVDGVRGGVEKLNKTVDQARDSLSKISADIESLNAVVEGQTAAVEESTASVNQMVSSIDSVAQVVDKRMEAVRALTLKAAEGGDKLKRTAEAISIIRGRVDEISDFATIINGIASQTNLLAMNAAIEAAHAGDAGRGFAVVADEIRKLAENAAQNSKGISDTISSVVTEILAASEAGDSTEKSFQAIEGGVRDLVSALENIHTASTELSAGGQEILRAMAELSDHSANVRDTSGRLEEKRLAVNDGMSSLGQLSQEVAGAMQEISAGVGEINSSMITVNDMAMDLKSAATELFAKIERFKS